MIRAVASGERLMQRMRTRGERIAAARASRRRRPSADWHSAAALWPDLFGDDPHGK